MRALRRGGVATSATTSPSESSSFALEGTDDLPYGAAQYTVLARLTRALRRRYPIVDIAGHNEIAQGRKTDPGPAFDWARLHRMLAPRAGGQEAR